MPPVERSQPFILPTFLGRGIGALFRVPVFRIAQGDTISKILIWAYNFFARFFCPSKGFRTFNEEIARTAQGRLEGLGAQFQPVALPDEQGTVTVMSFKADDFNRKIEELGGKWKKIFINGQEAFAIIPPSAISDEWELFKEQVKSFGWEVDQYQGQEVFITCRFADVILPDQKKCFLSVHSTSKSFIHFKHEMAYYLGMKQDFYFFDNGHSWLNLGRNCSEQGFYLETEEVYKQLIQDKYDPKNVWLGGFCGGAPVAAYLKKLHPELNFFASQSFCDLDDFNSIPSPRKWVASLLKGAIMAQEDRDLTEQGFSACAFSVERMWEGLSKSENNGKIMIIRIQGDEEISEEASERYVELANKVSDYVQTIVVRSKTEWKHIDYFYNHKKSRREFARVVF